MKHHYVPVFYQKHFAASDGLLWVYDRKLKTCKQLHPLSICFQNDLYAFKTQGPNRQVIETQFLRNVDGSASAAFKKLPSVLASPGPELLGEIIYFAALQCTRVPSNKQMVSMLAEGQAKDSIEVAFANVDRAAAIIKSYEAKTGEKVEQTPESMVKAAEALKSGCVKLAATEVPFLDSVVKHTEFIVKVFTELDIKLLISPPQVGFVLSDNPVTMVPHPSLKTAGFKSPGTFIFMPLTRRLCLRFGQLGTGNGPKSIDRETVRFINQNTAINSDRFVMGPSQMQIESVIHRSGSAEMNPNPRWTSVKRKDEKGGILRWSIVQPRRVHYREVLL